VQSLQVGSCDAVCGAAPNAVAERNLNATERSFWYANTTSRSSWYACRACSCSDNQTDMRAVRLGSRPRGAESFCNSLLPCTMELTHGALQGSPIPAVLRGEQMRCVKGVCATLTSSLCCLQLSVPAMT
jgi:hypothetical protein